ncbi:23S rRNA (pseudouridine(1915)-N(3))-methyltransferase RlmH [Fodinicurvata fenggangensis]|uniref:23S rRNA (pseudouridine(1915)-N(3))-methyltransferase RlmH n=1 Tax=Fodinicurvata fenggangensis TaxID=1121830 RepID=UPI00047B3495|nr:23S rRNA (pseudouridine(1915)-N(3))-methyltransferase RlmH [Fodinicurvata fenggangensis]
MQITILAVGRFRSGPQRALYEDYAARLKKGTLLGPLKLQEVEEKRNLEPARLKAREGELLDRALPEGARCIALDERGDNLDSAQLAGLLGQWREEGLRETVFLIGGADGLSPELRQRADRVLSFGRMTWPHLLVRGLLAEQVFRANAILSGHPYHRAD